MRVQAHQHYGKGIIEISYLVGFREAEGRPPGSSLPSNSSAENLIIVSSCPTVIILVGSNNLLSPGYLGPTVRAICCRPRLSGVRPRRVASQGRRPRLTRPASAAPPPGYSLTEPELTIGGKIVVNRKRISLFLMFSDTQLLRRGRRRCSHGEGTSGGGTMTLK